jgi:2-isopropylmalate synthase
MALPDKMKEEVGYLVKGVSDQRHQELSPIEIYRIFDEHYINIHDVFNIPECHFEQKDGIKAHVVIGQENDRRIIETSGNGRLDAVSNAIKTYFGISYELASYEEHAISEGSSSKAAAYVQIIHQGKSYWGVGIDEDIISSSIAALVAAANKMAKSENITEGRDERIVEIMNYIQNHYADVTLDVLSDNFDLSKPYLSKYIKEKSGMTFQEAVKKSRMKKARTMLKETNQTVESIAAYVGYENVEHFNRLFKKAYDMTPVQFRRKYQ